MDRKDLSVCSNYIHANKKEMTYHIECKVYKSDMTTLLGIVASEPCGKVLYINKEHVAQFCYDNQKVNSAGRLYSGKGSSNAHVPRTNEATFRKFKQSDFMTVETFRQALSKTWYT